ncbi:hypothetical protein Btru_005504 [Bulinus truncatus]|nr:hypothetical protein Btru_005504 [Bulinus truncatus]
MLLCIGFFVLHLFIFSSGQETTSNETCSRTPLPCVQASTAPIRHECNNDTQCGPGVMCCYTGCARTCVSTDPCDRVVCKLGYLCQTKVPPCQKSTCQTEAYCSPEEQVRCPALRCPTEYCQAGYERVVDSTGCPTCECKRKKDCSPTCSIFCTYGQITSEDGCPVCRCKKEPDNPCTNQGPSPCGLVVRLADRQGPSPCGLVVRLAYSKGQLPSDLVVRLADRQGPSPCGLVVRLADRQGPSPCGLVVRLADRQGPSPCGLVVRLADRQGPSPCGLVVRLADRQGPSPCGLVVRLADRQGPSPCGLVVRLADRQGPSPCGLVVRLADRQGPSPCGLVVRLADRQGPSPCGLVVRLADRQGPSPCGLVVRLADSKGPSPCGLVVRLADRKGPSPCGLVVGLADRQGPSPCDLVVRLADIQGPSPCGLMVRLADRQGPSPCALVVRLADRQGPSPCGLVTCSPDNECRLVAPPSCQTLPCKPQARCVAKIKSMYDNSCGIKDRTTVGRPVLEQDRVTELDCSQNRCPDASICSTFGANTHRCCWQYTQEQIWTPPKVGECPEEYMISASKESQLCEVDGQCPGEQKCCYRLKSSSLSQYIGACMSPVHKILENKTSLCKGSSIISSVLNMIGAC